MILEEANLNMTKITFKMNNSHHLYSLTIIQFCNVTDSNQHSYLAWASRKLLCYSQRLP